MFIFGRLVDVSWNGFEFIYKILDEFSPGFIMLSDSSATDKENNPDKTENGGAGGGEHSGGEEIPYRPLSRPTHIDIKDTTKKVTEICSTSLRLVQI